MTTNLLQNTKDGPAKDANGLAIGDDDAHVFNCPVCARPLSEGTAKCPGCGSYLIMGVRLKRASAILALGVVVGILLGGLTTAAAITMSLREPAAAVTPSSPPLAVVPSAAPSIDIPIVPANVAALSALSGTAVVNGRITVDADTLSSTLRRSNATSIEIARALRSLAADAALGIDQSGRLQPWTEAADVRSKLEAFYRDMADTARGGLRASLADVSAYRKAGDAMLKVLRTLGPVDAESRTLAGTVDLELPPVTLPD
jgi:hypothetical protein